MLDMDRLTTGRALVVDSDSIWLAAVERSLRSYGFRSVQTAARLQDAWHLLSGDEDVIVTEVVVDHETCFTFVAAALERAPHAVVVAMSDRAARPQVFRLKDCGVGAYLEKPFSTPALHECLQKLTITAVQRRAPGVSHEQPWNAAAELLLSQYRERYRLTSAEAELLRALLGGMRRGEIARERSISINTVKTQIRSILMKCNAGNMRELTRAFIRASRGSYALHEAYTAIDDVYTQAQ